MPSEEAGEDPDERQPHDDLAGEVCGGDGGHAEVEGGVGLLVLDGVTAFVGGDAVSGHGVAMVIFQGEHEAFVGGIIMIAEDTFLGDDIDIEDASALEDGLSDLGAGGVCGSGDFAEAVVDGFDSGGSPEGDEHGDDEEKKGEEVHWWKR